MSGSYEHQVDNSWHWDLRHCKQISNAYDHFPQVPDPPFQRTLEISSNRTNRKFVYAYFYFFNRMAAAYYKLLFSVTFLTFVSILYISFLHGNNSVCQCPNVTSKTNPNSEPSTDNNNDDKEEESIPVPKDNGNKSDILQLVIAVPTIPSTVERRTQMRLAMSRYKEVYCPYSLTPNPNPKVQLLFFLGRVTEGRVLIEAEQKIFNDIIILDHVPEAMNNGKTYEMLFWLTKNVKASFIMKADDDSFVVVPNLLKRLDHYTAQFPNRHIYYGFSIFEQADTRHVFMAGMGYILSFELTERLMVHAKSSKVGPEDIKVSNWVHRLMGEGTDVVQIGNTRHFHDSPHYKGIVSWQYNCQDVLLHQLKSTTWWNEAVSYYLSCCGVDARPADHAICTAKIESNTLCNRNATRGIDCFALKEHTRATIDIIDKDVFVRDEDVDLT